MTPPRIQWEDRHKSSVLLTTLNLSKDYIMQLSNLSTYFFIALQSIMLFFFLIYYLYSKRMFLKVIHSSLNNFWLTSALWFSKTSVDGHNSVLTTKKVNVRKHLTIGFQCAVLDLSGTLWPLLIPEYSGIKRRGMPFPGLRNPGISHYGDKYPLPFYEPYGKRWLYATLSLIGIILYFVSLEF